MRSWRFWLLFVVSLTLLLGLATACKEKKKEGVAPTPAALTGELEIFSWWTTGGEAAGLQALFDLYPALPGDVESSTRRWPAAPAQRAPGADDPHARRRPARLVPGAHGPRTHRHLGDDGLHGAAGRPLRRRGLERRLPAGRAGHRLLPGQAVLRAGEHPPRQRALVQQDRLRGEQPRAADDVRRVLRRGRRAQGRGHHAAGARRQRDLGVRPAAGESCWARSAPTATRASGPARRTGTARR